ncbi:uncharacterized protein LOC112596277 [Melanaphis sacchari]|uniref:uncharacterized protein LOC112596277 n=1 Tax=Melanaphis sacchari TaxID=742174 RepID=UPI000DC1396C|nr:uncharacterized protein LOC112596277 [Melanaphis sacchari]
MLLCHVKNRREKNVQKTKNDDRDVADVTVPVEIICGDGSGGSFRFGIDVRIGQDRDHLPVDPSCSEMLDILTSMLVMSSYCLNDHAVCELYMLTLLNMKRAQENLCLLCRKLMSTSTTVNKLIESSHLVKVKYSNSPHGCIQLVPVRTRTNMIPHVPNYRTSRAKWALFMFTSVSMHDSHTARPLGAVA